MPSVFFVFSSELFVYYLLVEIKLLVTMLTISIDCSAERIFFSKKNALTIEQMFVTSFYVTWKVVVML